MIFNHNTKKERSAYTSVKRQTDENSGYLGIINNLQMNLIHANTKFSSHFKPNEKRINTALNGNVVPGTGHRGPLKY